VTSLGSARWFVGENANTVEFITRNFVGYRLQRASVERAGDAIASIRTAIKKRLEMHCRNCPVLFHPGLHVHEHGVAAPMTIKDFFARQSAFHRPSGDHRQFADDDFVIERIAFAAKTAAVWRGNHTDVTRRNLQDFS
jgi:hypothetical protein